jgi:hypothetical protein
VQPARAVASAQCLMSAREKELRRRILAAIGTVPDLLAFKNSVGKARTTAV